jgi:hypothetical protein
MILHGKTLNDNDKTYSGDDAHFCDYVDKIVIPQVREGLQN